MAVERDLQLEDILELEEADKGAKAPAVKRITNRHHLLARFLAEGRSPAEAGRLTGYSPSRISILQADPAFAELLSAYAEGVQMEYFHTHEKLAALALDTAEELHDRLEEKPETFSNAQLQSLMEACLDRSVAPKKGTPQLNVNFNGSGDVKDVASEVAKIFGTAQQVVATSRTPQIEGTCTEVRKDEDGLRDQLNLGE